MSGFPPPAKDHSRAREQDGHRRRAAMLAFFAPGKHIADMKMQADFVPVPRVEALHERRDASPREGHRLRLPLTVAGPQQFQLTRRPRGQGWRRREPVAPAL